MVIAETMFSRKTLNGKNVVFLKANFNSVNGKMSSKIYHKSCYEDNEHLIETVYYILKPIVLSAVCNLH